MVNVMWKSDLFLKSLSQHCCSRFCTCAALCGFTLLSPFVQFIPEQLRAAYVLRLCYFSSNVQLAKLIAHVNHCSVIHIGQQKNKMKQNKQTEKRYEPNCGSEDVLPFD